MKNFTRVSGCENFLRKKSFELNFLLGIVLTPMFVSQQGLFHPARKVRDVYWKIYNSIYIGSQDALIAHYPLVYNDEKNPYVRYELEYFL